MMNISDHIGTYYRIRQIGAVPGFFEKAEEFLLSTNYDSPGHLEVHDIFIKNFSEERDVVLVEGGPLKNQAHIKASSVAEFSRKNLMVLRWNDDDSFAPSKAENANSMEIDDLDTELFLHLRLLNSLTKLASVGARRFLIASAVHLEDPELLAALMKRNLVILQPREKAAHNSLFGPSGR